MADHRKLHRRLHVTCDFIKLLVDLELLFAGLCLVQSSFELREIPFQLVKINPLVLHLRKLHEYYCSFIDLLRPYPPPDP